MGFFDTMQRLFESKQQRTERLAQERARTKQDVMGRMAASNVVSQASTEAGERLKEDIVAAHQRVERFEFNDPNVQRFRADLIVEAIIWMLQNSELTVQFPPDKLFELDPNVLGDRWANVWDLPGIRSGDYLGLRDKAENNLFNYTGSSAPYVSQHGDVGLRQDTKTYLNGSFSTYSRPQYASVNFLRYAGGGAGQSYGKGVLALKPYIILQSTFTEQDSFKVTNPDNLGTYFNLYPLIVNCNRNLLNALGEVACLNKPQFVNPGYLEAQNHCPLYFNRDVAAVRIEQATFNSLSRKQKNNLNTFLTRNGLSSNFTKYGNTKDQLPGFEKPPVEMMLLD